MTLLELDPSEFHVSLNVPLERQVLAKMHLLFTAKWGSMCLMIELGHLQQYYCTSSGNSRFIQSSKRIHKDLYMSKAVICTRDFVLDAIRMLILNISDSIQMFKNIHVHFTYEYLLYKWNHIVNLQSGCHGKSTKKIARIHFTPLLIDFYGIHEHCRTTQWH